ncbi:MAG: diacylglycerol kinase [Candidatus Omnitrophica bacterium]|nr:diacylglycerol kinase [Candidatus Omnitrophota bacterium]MBU1785203.1 diacylglycerol kinase [Candidatus Omnitrophota bacterium]MBU1852074.1 diacylglycerol kinase [Candidatus Omnitrophota bacterium]
MRFQERSGEIGSGSFSESVNAALEGIVHTLQNERNMRVHFIAAFFVLIGGIYLNLDYVGIILLLFAISIVLIAEMFNTAIESLSDIVVKEQFHPIVKIIKDVSAGAVFVAALNAGLTGYMLVSGRINLYTGELLLRIRQSPGHVTLIALLVCVGLVVLIKVAGKAQHLLKGGMPSGHSAVAFAAWMAVWLLTSNSLVSILVFLMAGLIARSRMAHGTHSLWEVVAGSVLGALTMLFVFQILL